MKQQTLKKVISLALAGAMSISNLAAFSAFAEETEAGLQAEVVAEEAIAEETEQPAPEEAGEAEAAVAELAAQTVASDAAEPTEPELAILAEQTETVPQEQEAGEIAEPELAADAEEIIEEATAEPAGEAVEEPTEALAEETTEEPIEAPTTENVEEPLVGAGETYQLMEYDIPYVISDATDSNARDLCHYMFKWADDGDTTDAEGYVCHYSDALFNGRSAAIGLGDGKATTYNPVLVNTTMCLTMTAFNSVEIADENGKPDLTRQSQNARNLLKAMGFTNPTQNEFFNKTPTTTSIGVVAAYKMIEDNEGNADKVPLVAIAIRGSGYQAEWAGNVTLGLTGDHAGFSLAADQTLGFVKEYLAEQAKLDPALAKADHVKVWVTGFSRAAATANLTAAKLDYEVKYGGSELIGKAVRSNDDIFAYTFETPKGHLMNNTDPDENTYKNIFNIINPNDLVPMVAPVSLGFERYGVDKILPSKENNAYYSTTYLPLIEKRLNTRSDKKWINVLDAFYHLNGIEDLANLSNLKTAEAYPTQGIFFNDFIANLAEDGVGTRDKFVNSGLETSLQHLMEDFMGSMLTNAQLAKFTGTFSLADIDPLVKILWEIIKAEKQNLVRDAKALFIAHSKQAGLEAILTDAKCAEIAESMGDLILVLRDQLMADPAIMVSMIGNEVKAMKEGGEHVTAGHSVSLCKAWLEQMDPKETGKPINFEDAFTAGEYRRITISRAPDVKVKDLTTGVEYDFSEDGIMNYEEVQESDIAMMTVTDIHNRMVFLPTNHAYEVTVKFGFLNMDNARVYFKVEEFNPAIAKQKGSGQYKRLTVFSGHPRIGGSTFTLTVPAMTPEEVKNGTPEGSNVAYTMTNSAGEKITTQDYKLRDLNNRYTDVNVISNQFDLGACYELGASLHIKGDLVYLYADPIPGASFVGWMDEKGEVISTESDYVYTIPEDAGEAVNLYADFTFCKAPENVSVVNAAGDLEHPEMLVSWTHTFEDEDSAALTDGFNIYRDDVKIAEVDGRDETQYLDKDVAPGVYYVYTVRARSISFNDEEEVLPGIRAYESAPSEAVKHRANLWLVPPKGLTAEDKRDGDKLFIEINWNALSEAELALGEVDGYYVYRDDVLLNRTGLTTGYTDYGVENGKTYTYTVCTKSSAKDELGEAQVSPMSDPAQVLVELATAPDVSTNRKTESNTNTATNTASHDNADAAQPARDSYKVVANISDGGTISNLGTTEVAAGGSMVYTITPLAGYKVSYVKVDGKDVGAVTSYTFTGMSGDHEILAVFTQDGGARSVNSKIPQTADEQPLVIWVVLALGSMTACGALATKKRREN